MTLEIQQHVQVTGRMGTRVLKPAMRLSPLSFQMERLWANLALAALPLGELDLQTPEAVSTRLLMLQVNIVD